MLTYLPTYFCTMSCGALARFSAQSVSMIPSVGCSTATTKPFCDQKSRIVLHAASGVVFTTSHRSDPERTSRASALVGRIALGLPAARAAAAAEAAHAG